MKKWLLTMLVAAFLPFSANAAVIVQVLGEANGANTPPFPNPEVVIGTYNFDLTGQRIVSASLRGTFGNSQNPSSAATDVFADGMLVARCNVGAPCFFSPRTPWAFNYTDFSSLLDGQLTLSFVQTSAFITRLGRTVLRIVTEEVPAPGTLALIALGLLGGLGFVRRKKA